MKTYTISILISLLLLCACSEAPAEKSAATNGPASPTAETEQPQTTPDTEASETTPPVVKLSGKFLREQDHGMQEYLVLLEVDGKTHTIDTVSACETIPAEDFDRYEIPKEAVTACGGWFAGAGDYFYAVIRNSKPVVYYGWQDEGQEGAGFHWKMMKL